MWIGYLYIYLHNAYTTAVCEACACVGLVAVCVVGVTFAPVMLHVVLTTMLFQEINKHSYGRLCCSPLTMAHNLFHDLGVETLYAD